MCIRVRMRDRVLFVIRNHLKMVRYFYKYDLEDPKVIGSFAAFVGSKQRLRYLYVHTYCDANGTAPDLWNQHKDDVHPVTYTHLRAHKTKANLVFRLLLEKKKKQQKKFPGIRSYHIFRLYEWTSF